MNLMYQTTLLPFEQLNLNILYDILALRNQVFIVEQKSIYQDLDYKDQKAQHLLIHDQNNLAAYARVQIDEQAKTIRFGRILTSPFYRGKGLGKQLIHHLIKLHDDNYPDYLACMSAQYYLLDFYHDFGFLKQGEAYILDGIKHIDMVRPNE